jgi:hypothetical protein
MPESEDLTRYTAPPDNQPDEPRYSTAGILAYIDTWIPGWTADFYTLDEVRDILKEAADNLTDEDHGIDTV